MAFTKASASSAGADVVHASLPEAAERSALVGGHESSVTPAETASGVESGSEKEKSVVAPHL